jgi:hypothetical protein
MARNSLITRAKTDVEISSLVQLISSQQPMEEEERSTLESIASVLQENVGTVRNMAYKRKGLLSLTPQEIEAKISTIASVIDVPVDKARRMAVIQPGLFFDTEKQAGILKSGIAKICYDLSAPKDDIVNLILENQSVLHGRELHLSVADIAHLAILYQEGPNKRIVD